MAVGRPVVVLVGLLGGAHLAAAATDPRRRHHVVHVEADAEAALAALVAEGGNQERRRVDEVRRQLDHQLALEQRLADQAEVEVLQVAQAAVDHLRGAARGAFGVVAALQQRHRVPARGRVERDPGAGDAAADDDDLEVLAGDRLDCGRAGEHQSRKTVDCSTGGRSGGSFSWRGLAEVQEADEALVVGQARRPRDPPRAQQGRRAPVAGEPAGVGAEQDDVGGDRGRVQVLLVLDRVAAERAGDDDQGRGAVELRRPLRPGGLLQARQRGRTDDAKAPGRGQVVVRRPAGQLEQLEDLLARERLRPEGLVGAARPDRGLDVHQREHSRRSRAAMPGEPKHGAPAGQPRSVDRERGLPAVAAAEPPRHGYREARRRPGRCRGASRATGPCRSRAPAPRRARPAPARRVPAPPSGGSPPPFAPDGGTAPLGPSGEGAPGATAAAAARFRRGARDGAGEPDPIPDAGCAAGRAIPPSASSCGAAARPAAHRRRRRPAPRRSPRPASGRWKPSSGSGRCLPAGRSGSRARCCRPTRSRRVGPDRDHPLDRPGGRLGVDPARAAQGEAAVGALVLAQVGEAALRAAAVSGIACIAAAVTSALLGCPGSSPQPPSPFWTLPEPGQRLVQAAGGARGAQRDHAVGRLSRASPRRSRSWRGAACSSSTRSWPPNERGSTPAPSQGEDRPGEVAAAAHFVDVRAQEVDRGGAAAGDVERVAARRLEPQHRPAGDRGARGVARARSRSRRRSSAPIRASRRHGRRSAARAEPGTIAGSSSATSTAVATAGGAPLEALAEADQHPHHRRPGEQGEGDVADRVGQVERDRHGPPARGSAGSRGLRRRSPSARSSTANRRRSRRSRKPRRG